MQWEKIGLQCVNVWFTKFSCLDGKLAKGAYLRKPKGATAHFGFYFSLFLFRFLVFSLVLHFDFIFFALLMLFFTIKFLLQFLFFKVIILKNKNKNQYQEIKNKTQKIEKTKNRRGRPSCFAVGSIWRMGLSNRRRPGL